MKLVHTADWHLGHTLHDLPRDEEHAAFLAWLADLLEAEAADALLIAGDVFETANPGAAAQRALFEHLAGLRRRVPHLQVVLIGGNHDSAPRLDAWAPLLAAVGVHVVGGLVRPGERELDLERLVVPLRRADGAVEAWVAAVPFLRPTDLPMDPTAGDWLVEGAVAVYERVLAAARARRAPDQALVGMGHGYLVGGQLSALSERKVLCGNQHALPGERLFPDDVAYAALGHLHRAQRVGGRDHVRYSGSPLPLSMAEADYAHQVLVVELAGPALATPPRVVRVPRTVELLRLPREGPRPLPEVLPLLAKLPAAGAAGPAPYLEVRVQADGPAPTLRADVEAALEGRHARLVRLAVDRPDLRQHLAAATGDSPQVALPELTPDEVLRRRWAALYAEQAPPDAVLAAYHELVERVGQAGAT